MEGRHLITTDYWFYAPDGKKYRSAWGNVTIVQDTELGIKTNRGSTNWYAKIGDEDRGVIVAGCQIHYAVKCESLPNQGEVTETHYSEGKQSVINRDSEIYIAEKIKEL